jgi:hypothetical protein
VSSRTREGWVRVNVEIPQGLRKRVRVAGAERGKTLGEAVVEGLEGWVGDEDKKEERR